MTATDEFLAILAKGPHDRSCIFNPWRDWDDRDRIPKREAQKRRRENLAAYLEARERSARFLLLGEAPSHRGCRFTGIAFCSETELAKRPALVARRELALTSRDAHAKPQRERSAAVIWDEIERAGAAFEVVLWNAFPWHPYRAQAPAGEVAIGPCGPTSNRRPRLTEVAHGRQPLSALLRCFRHRLEIFAVGKVAEEGLGRWPEFACSGYMRHPAQGGEAKFRAAFRQHIASRL